jgi:plasmid stability protein
MRNVTISMDEELHQKVRVDAAKAGMSMSKYITEILSSAKSQVDRERDDRLEADLARLRAVFDGPKLDISVNGRMPSSEERNARR